MSNIGREYYKGEREKMICLILQDTSLVYLKSQDIATINRYKFFRTLKNYFPSW